MSSAFENIRVIDLSTRLSGAFAGRQFADYGAEVLLIEPAGGHALQMEPPFAESLAANPSLVHAYVNWNKQSIQDPDDEELADLVRGADILITTSMSPWTPTMVRAIDSLPDLGVHLSITPHGLEGPLASTPGNHLTHCARSGWSVLNSLRDEPPLQLPRGQSDYVAGTAGFVAAAAALFRARETGLGERVDVSELEALASTSAPWAILGIFFNAPRLEYGPGGPRSRDTPGPVWQTADGMMNYGFGEWPNWRKAMELFGLPDIGADPRYEPVLGRHGNDLRPVAQALAEASRTRKKWDLFNGLADLHCISGVVQNTRELLENEHLKARDFFVETEIAGRAVNAPGAPARLSESSWQYYRPAPKTGSAEDVAGRSPQPGRTKPNGQRRLPLAGIRVLTFTQAWSGTFGTEILSLLGADVIQVEGRKRPDVWRGAGAPVPRAVANPDIEQSPLNTNGMFNSVNLNKRAITLDMTRPEGREIFWKMVPGFDIVAENFSTKVMANWGITLESLREVRPDIIFASLSGYGQDGPLARYPANGNTTEPMSGLSSVNGYEGDEGANTGGLIPDPISGYHFAGAILAALHYRQQTGNGQRIDLSMMESVAVQLGDRILDYTVNGKIAAPEGNRHPRMAPHNVYKTADDRRVAIATEDERQWRALATIIGIDDDRFASMAQRKQHEQALDDIIGAWCSREQAASVEAKLTAQGINAAVMQSFLGVYRNPPPQFLARDYLVQVTHPESGTHYMPTVPWVLRKTEPGPIRYSPCFGEHSLEVFREELGMSEQQYNELEADGITGTTRL